MYHFLIIILLFFGRQRIILEDGLFGKRELISRSFSIVTAKAAVMAQH